MISTITPGDRFKWYTRKRVRHLSMQEKALIIELFIYHKMSIIDISKMEGLTYQRVTDIVSLYFIKPEHGICIMSKV